MSNAKPIRAGSKAAGVHLRPSAIVKQLPDNARRPKGSENPRSVSKKIWVDEREAQEFAELAEMYNSSESALIRWLIDLGLSEMYERAQKDPMHRAIHAAYGAKKTG